MSLYEKNGACRCKQIVAKGAMLFVLLFAAALVHVSVVDEESRKTEKTVNFYLDEQFDRVTTKAETVAEMLAERGLHIRSSDLLTPDADTELVSGMDIYLQKSFPVYVQADGQLKLVYTTAATIAELLAERGIKKDENDRVYPGLTAPLSRGDRVRVVRVSTKFLQEECPIPFNTVTRKDATKPEGYRSVAEEGEPGKALRTYSVVYADGQEESRELVAEECLQEPKDRIIVIGTKPAPVAVASRGDKERAVYEGTASWISDRLHGRKTAYGDIYNKDAFTCAFPDKELRGKTLRVTYLKTGRSVDVRVNDYGPHIKGRIIDLSRAAAEAIGLINAGIGRVRIEVLD